MFTFFLIAILWHAALIAATFAAYAWDKRAARTGRRRIRNRTLHTFELLGGWPGALAAQHLLRHKSADRWFRFITRLMIAAHLAVLAAAFALASALARGSGAIALAL